MCIRARRINGRDSLRGFSSAFITAVTVHLIPRQIRGILDCPAWFSWRCNQHQATHRREYGGCRGTPAFGHRPLSLGLNFEYTGRITEHLSITLAFFDVYAVHPRAYVFSDIPSWQGGKVSLRSVAANILLRHAPEQNPLHIDRLEVI